MKCPHCVDSTLVMAERQGVEIDYCPTCRGIWLDRGELDKLLERAASAAVTDQPVRAAAVQGTRYPDFEESDFRERQRDGRGKRKSWLHEIFD